MFKSPDNMLTTEVIAEVADVVIRTEEVLLRLPSPFQHTQDGLPCCNMASLPYLQALLHTSSYVVDAISIINSVSSLQSIPTADAMAINENDKKRVLDRFRFSIRFNFQGGRGFDIIRNCLETTDREVGPNRKNEKRCISKTAERRLHLSRVIAPTIGRVKGVKSIAARENLEGLIERELNFVNPINPQQKQAVLEIVSKCHGLAPYIIEGPAGTGTHKLELCD